MIFKYSKRFRFAPSFNQIKSEQYWVCAESKYPYLAESEIWNLNQNLRSWVLSFNWCSKRKNYVGKISLKSTEKCEFHSAQGRDQDLNLAKKVRYQERIVAKNFIKWLIPCKNFMKWMFTRQKLYKMTVHKKKMTNCLSTLPSNFIDDKFLVKSF